jgi:homoserine dehydrogenase
VVTSYYLRLRVADQAGVLAKVTGLLAQCDISIDAVLQRPASEGESQTDLIILTTQLLRKRHEPCYWRNTKTFLNFGTYRSH